jgi:para-nitrobenzyl esterase
MKRPSRLAFLCATLVSALVLRAQPATPVQLKTADGILEGVVSGDGTVRTFKGIPYAAPPVGALRWAPPQPVVPWTGVRPASEFGPRAMQGRIFDDMVFHDAGPSEDCLYLNVWLPAKPASDKLPVMFWIHGGGFVAGGSSEPRQDGGNLCKNGVLVVSLNYRMGIFGFFSHPELSKESPHGASGNQGLLDIVAALQWVKRNIATFGGDPDNVTIFGESAGSYAVSALVASPLAQGLFHKAIGESGAILNPARPQLSLAEAEAQDLKFAETGLGVTSLEKLRALPASALLDADLKAHRWARPVIDGWFLPQDATSIYAAGRQNHVPLLAGWNLDEGGPGIIFEKDEPTLANYATRAKAIFGDQAGAFLKAYAATTDAEAKRAAADYGGDRFIGYGTWKWIDLHRQTAGVPVWRYKFEQTLPAVRPDAPKDGSLYAPHASEIEYVFQVLSSRQAEWGAEHHRVSDQMAGYWTNFAKTGNPNGPGLPVWPAYEAKSGDPVMHLNAASAAAPATDRARYEFIEAFDARAKAN